MITLAAALDFETATTYTLTITATDNSATADSDTETLVINVTDVEPEGVAPVLTAIADVTISANTLVATVVDADATDADSATLTYAISGDSNFVINSSTGVVSTDADGAPAATYNLTVTVTDDQSNSVSDSFVVTANAGPVDETINVSAASSLTAGANNETFVFAEGNYAVSIAGFDLTNDILICLMHQLQPFRPTRLGTIPLPCSGRQMARFWK